VSRFQFVEDHRDAFGVKRLCQVLGVNRSSYYKWRTSAETRELREAADAALADQIRAVHADSDGAYGSARITAELRGNGRKINEKRVARVMRKFAIAGIRLRRRVRTTIPEPTATPVPDLFQRDFTATEPGAQVHGVG
jgi:transposase InsO family protein